MKIAIIVPWVYAISGNIIAIDLAAELHNQGHRVDFIVLEAFSGVVTELSRELRGASLILFRKISKNKHGKMEYLVNQLLRDMGKELLKELRKSENKLDYDVVLLISDEGISLAKHIRNLNLRKTPLVCYSVMELVEHNFFLRKQSYLFLRNILTYPIYLFLHRRFAKLISYYSLVFCNSEWTSMVSNYFYNIWSAGEIQSVSNVFFETELKEPGDKGGYIVVPTASLGKEEKKIVTQLRNSGFEILFYGPVQVDDPDYLGFLPKRELIELISGANALLFLFDYEALGLIPIEALALGTPVITYLRQGPSMSIKDSECVTYVRNYEEILCACKLAMRKPPLIEEKLKCRNSVIRFMPTINAENFVRRVTQYNSESVN